MSKQSAIEWHDVIIEMGQVAQQGADPDTALSPDVLFALQLDRLTPGSSHVGGRHGAVVRCPRCKRSACFIGGRRYAHGVRLVRHWSSTRNPSGDDARVLEVRPEWQGICTGGIDRPAIENAELLWDGADDDVQKSRERTDES